MAPVFISVAGPSCSGKSTLARVLAEQTNALLIHVDKFYKSDVNRPIINGYPSYERPDQYDGERALKEALEKYENERTSIIFEGFMALTYPNVPAVSDFMFMLDVPFDEQVRRRKLRSASKEYDGVWERARLDIDEGFYAHGAEEWKRFGETQKSIPGVTVLNGMDTPENILKQAVDILKG